MTGHDLRAEGLRPAYDAKVVVEGLTLAIPVALGSVAYGSKPIAVGRVGTHDELVDAGGLYAALRVQTGDAARTRHS